MEEGDEGARINARYVNDGTLFGGESERTYAHKIFRRDLIYHCKGQVELLYQRQTFDLLRPLWWKKIWTDWMATPRSH
jgi:hypothetical protein